MSLPEFPKRHPETAFRNVGDEGGLVVLPGTQEVKVLNPVGIKIFALLDGEHSLDAIARAVVEEFEISPEQAQEDLGSFLRELQADGMLEDLVAEKTR